MTPAASIANGDAPGRERPVIAQPPGASPSERVPEAPSGPPVPAAPPLGAGVFALGAPQSAPFGNPPTGAFVRRSSVAGP